MMNRLVGLLCLGMFLTGCKNELLFSPKVTPAAASTSSCTVSKVGTTSKIQCPDGSSTIINDGRDGESCHVTKTEDGANIECTNGESVEISNGAGCTVQEAVNGTVVACGSESVVIYHDEDNVPSPHTISEVIDPCGNGPGYDEVLLKTQNGDIIAFMEMGTNRFLTILPAGTYNTTDGQNCRLTITADNEVLF